MSAYEELVEACRKVTEYHDSGCDRTPTESVIAPLRLALFAYNVESALESEAQAGVSMPTVKPVKAVPDCQICSGHREFCGCQ